MPAKNLRGGKVFKKGKKADDTIVKFSPKEEGQDYARVVKLLGDRRATCFCNDGKERIGKFRGAICRGPKKQIITAGDVVLISLREFEEVTEEENEDKDVAELLKETKVGPCDILYKYEKYHWRALRSEPLHPELLGLKEEKDDIFDYDVEEEVDLEKI